METKEILLAARELIKYEDHWTKGSFKKDDKFCAIGAIEEVCGFYRPNVDRFITDPEKISDAKKATEALRACLPATHEILGLSGYNDSKNTTHKDILNLYDCAIAKA